MCQSPSTLPDGTTFACRKCPQCRDLYIDDWEGRNIAESKSATATYAITLTYGRVDNEVHHAHSVALFYSDVQKYIKLLRYHGYVVRYFNAGEFGGLKGRTHWHVILHFYGAVPPHVLNEDFMHEAVKADGKPVTNRKGETRYFWPHGWSHWKKAHKGTVRYNAKYALKDVDDLENQSLLQMTKNPPLGAIYFREMARSAAQQGAALHDASYSFAGVTYKKGPNAGKRRKYMLRGKCEEIFVTTYLEEWAAVHGTQPPQTQYLREWDKGWKRELRRIAERRKERVGKWTVRDHFNHEADAQRRREIELKIREEQNPTYYEPPPKKARRSPRDHDEWKWQFEKEWVIYGKTWIGQKRGSEQGKQQLEQQFERVWQQQADERSKWLEQLWFSRQWPDRNSFYDEVVKLDKERRQPQREQSEFERWALSRPKFRGVRRNR